LIISASRRTDIPAFYADWFINRIRAGWCLVPNPINSHQLSFVPLLPEDVTAIVFWSKNPEPLMQYLDEIDRRGFRYYFQFTLNDYPKFLEPRVPNIDDRIETFKNLSEKLGNLRVIWRYDPVIISNITSMDFHIDKFSEIAKSLKGYTNRVMISFVDYYKKTDLRLEDLQEHGFEFEREFSHSTRAFELLNIMRKIADENQIEIFTCAEEVNFKKVGVLPGFCIDPNLINKLWSVRADIKKDPTQRPVCLCAMSKDIGINDTCLHGCVYCYATRKIETAEKRHLEHNINSPVIWGETRPLTDVEQSRLLVTRLL
jgi:DNA repair photolyase